MSIRARSCVQCSARSIRKQCVRSHLVGGLVEQERRDVALGLRLGLGHQAPLHLAVRGVRGGRGVAARRGGFFLGRRRGRGRGLRPTGRLLRFARELRAVLLGVAPEPLEEEHVEQKRDGRVDGDRSQLEFVDPRGH